MHEYSIVDSLLNLADKYARENNALKVIKLEVKIGELSGVEPELLRMSFETFKESTVCEEAEFIMNLQSVVIRCHVCAYEGEIEKKRLPLS